MTAATFVAPEGKTTKAIGGDPGVGARVLHCLYVQYDVPETPEVGDLYSLGWLPKGAVPVGGYLATTDIDTGTETFDMDLGIADNGVDAADPDYFVNGGVETGDNAITDFPFTNAVNVRLITGPFPTVTQLGAKTLVQAKVIAVANAGATGTIVVCIHYLMPGKTTS